MIARKGIAAGVAVALAGTSLGGCATNGEPLTTEQRIAGCAAAIVGGALLGALIGSQVDGRRGGGSGVGAAIGSAVGGAACAVWLAFENEKDRERMRLAQLEAVRTGQPQTDSWTGEDGRVRSVRVTPSTETQAMVPAEPGQGAAPRQCRSAAVEPSVDGQIAAPMSTVWCRTADGNYEPATTQMVAVAA